MSAPGAAPLLTADELAAVEAEVATLLRAGHADGVKVLGYGEITLVLGWPAAAPRVACKRLPVFRDPARADAYGASVTDYVAALRGRGIDVVPTEWRTARTAEGVTAGYVLQPVLPGDSLAPALLAAQPPTGDGVLERIVDTIVATVTEQVGIDGQLSNWACTDGALRYFDVTTPLFRDPAGRSRLDLDLLTSPLPALIRPIVRRAVAPGIVARYHDARDVLVDLAGNLLKERLDAAVDPTLARANQHVEPAITRAEVERYYRSDARTWEALLRLRRADRWWQRTVRRRTYPFLLPGAIRR